MCKFSIIFSIICVFFIKNNLYAQYPETLIRKGNSEYKKEKYQEAEKQYRKANQKDTSNIKALFNLGDALYKQKQYNQAAKVFNDLLSQKLDESIKARVYHNLGNSYLNSAISNDTLNMETKQNIIKQSIDSYKKSLRLQPDDDETRYNYVYANKLLKKIEQQQQNQEQNNKNNNKQQNKDEQQNQQQQDKDKESKNQKQQQSKPEISKEDAEKMLEALKNNEKNTREKLEKDKQKKVNVKINIENDW